MLFPIRTDRPPRRRPIVTHGLIALNVLVYIGGMLGPRLGTIDLPGMAEWGHFDPRSFKWWQLITALFLHSPASVWHLAFNMLALWVFGPPVEGRLGRVGFLGFYLMAGAVANLAHMMVSPAPVIGASGAIAGVTGIFLALFPRSHVICFYIFSGGLIVVSSLWFIGLYFVVDVLRQTRMMFGGHDGANIAYMAHIAGYVYGFALGFALLGLKVVPREEYDVFFLFKQWRRRTALRSANRGSIAGSWDAPTADSTARRHQRASAPEFEGEDAEIADARAEVHRLIASHDLPAAARAYRGLLGRSGPIALGEQRQLDIANQFAAEGDHASAAAAYELLLKHYPRTASADEVRLLLGLLYARNLRQPGRARELIEAVRERLRDASQQRLAEQILMELPS